MVKQALWLAMIGLSLILVWSVAMSQTPTKVTPPGLATAPSLDEDDAKKKLEVLKGRLPDILATWIKERVGGLVTVSGDEPSGRSVGKLKVMRRTSPTTAKITFSIEPEPPGPVALLSLNLNFCDGMWTTTGVVRGTDDFEKVGYFLMLAIDKAAAEK